MTRYLLVTNFESGVDDTPMREWRPEEVTAHLDHYGALHRELVASGELVASEVLTGPDLARIVTSDGTGAPVVTDGPFQEFTEWLAGYQIVDVGTALLDRAIRGGGAGEYQIQAAIAAVHSRAPRAADTDWPHILALYGLLEQLTGNPVVTLNRAVAAAMAEGPAAGLALLDGVEDALAGHYRLHAVRAHLSELAGDTEAALTHYRAAAARTTSVPEQHYLAARAARLRPRDQD